MSEVIWKLNTDSEYLSLGLVDEFDARVMLDYSRGKVPRWAPVRVTYSTDVYDDTDKRHERVPNFPSLSTRITCDDEAKSTVEDMLKGYAEFLPLVSDEKVEKQYYILHPTRVIDCEDRDRSDWEDFIKGRPDIGRSVHRFAFKRRLIGDAPMFILPGSAGRSPFVTDRFKQLIEDNNLTGLTFKDRGDAFSDYPDEAAARGCRGIIWRTISNFISPFSRRR